MKRQRVVPGDDGLPAGARRWAMVAIALAITMAVLDSAVANIALPTIARELRASAAATVWVVNGYQLAIVVALLPLSALAQRVGYARIYIGGLILFTIGSLGCALSPDLPVLVAARAVQGLGAAGIMSVNGALVRTIYPGSLLGRGIGINALVVSAAAAVGPSLASAILAVANWPWLFAINVPIGIANIALAARVLPGSPLTKDRMDWASVLLSAVAFGLFFVALGGLGRAARGRTSADRAGACAGARRGRGPRAAGDGGARAAGAARPPGRPDLRAVGHGVGLRLFRLHAHLHRAALPFRD